MNQIAFRHIKDQEKRAKREPKSLCKLTEKSTLRLLTIVEPMFRRTPVMFMKAIFPYNHSLISIQSYRCNIEPKNCIKSQFFDETFCMAKGVASKS